MLKFFKNSWPYIVVILLCFWAVKPLFVPGFFPIHDDEQIARVFELDKALHDGQFPVRWVQDLGFGYGYPLFNFYPPVSYYSAEIFHISGFSFIDSVKLVFLLGFLLSALFMYLWTKNHFGKVAGIFSALLYIYAPYHAVEIYVRGSMPGFLGYALIPATFWLVDILFEKKKLNTAIFLGISLAFIPSSHILKIISFTPFFVIYVAYLLWEYKKEIKKILPLLFLSFAVSFGLLAFFLIPSVLEKSYTLVDKVNVGELYNYQIHFVCLRQFLNSPWGYGGSVPGCFDGLSFEIGKIHLLFAFISLLFFIYFLIKRKISKVRVPFLIFLMFLFSIYMANSHSIWIWDRVKILSYLQFPWRFLTMAAVFSSFLAGFAIYSIKKYFGETLALISVLIFSAVAIFIVITDFKPQSFLNVSDNHYTNLNDISWRVSKASFEFTPSGVATKLSDIKTTQIDLEEKDIPKFPYKILKGEANIKVISDKSQVKKLEIDSKTEATIQFNTFSFPGWRTFLDEKEVQYDDKNKLKLITVEVPKGKHMLSANFTNTIPRAVGNAITLVTIFNLIGFGLLKIWKR